MSASVPSDHVNVLEDLQDFRSGYSVGSKLSIVVFVYQER